MDINTITIIGTLTKDSEITFTKSGTAKLEFSIAFTTTKKDSNGEWQKKSNFINGLNVWGKSAENLEHYLKKGVKVGISGHLEMDSWKDKEGNNKSALKVICDNLQLLGGGKGNSENSSVEQTSDEGTGFPEDVPF